MTLFQTG